MTEQDGAAERDTDEPGTGKHDDVPEKQSEDAGAKVKGNVEKAVGEADAYGEG